MEAPLTPSNPGDHSGLSEHVLTACELTGHTLRWLSRGLEDVARASADKRASGQ